jgi:microcystin-dependent protein
MAVATISQLSLTPIFDNNGALVRNARVYFYRPGTLDPVTVYQDQELGAPHTQPILVGGSGRLPPIYVGAAPYRVRIFDNANQLVEDIPWLPGATESTEGGGGGAADTAIRTGDVVWSFANGTVRAGWVRLNGGTIGNSLSGASERANDDAHNLFVHLWGQDNASLLTVSPSRGASAESDWLANKQITLPDGAGMVLGGITTMGRPERAVLAGVPFAVGSPTAVGARMGTALHTLLTTQMPIHAHGVTDPGHNHTATQPAHNHGVNDPGHNHTLNDPGHAHSVYDPGHNHYVNDPGHGHSISDPGHRHAYSKWADSGTRGGGGGPVQGSTTTSVESGTDKTGISINGALTGIYLSASGTGIGIYGSGTGCYNSAAYTGISTQNAQPAITVANKVTGLTVNNEGGGQAHNNVQPTLLGTFYMKL